MTLRLQKLYHEARSSDSLTGGIPSSATRGDPAAATRMRINFYPMQAIAVQPPWEGEEVWYPSLVLDYEEGTSLSIGAPLSRGQEVLIPPGTRVRLQLALPDGLRRFTAIVRQRHAPAGNPIMLDLTWPEDFQRIQRRDNVRVDATLRVEVSRIREDDSRGPPLFGVTADLSAGGTRIRLAEPIEVLTPVQLTFTFPNEEEHVCDGRVLRRGELTQAVTDLRHWMAIEFTGITEVVRREITRLVFDLQREQIRKGVA